MKYIPENSHYFSHNNECKYLRENLLNNYFNKNIKIKHLFNFSYYDDRSDKGETSK